MVTVTIEAYTALCLFLGFFTGGFTIWLAQKLDAIVSGRN